MRKLSVGNTVGWLWGACQAHGRRYAHGWRHNGVGNVVHQKGHILGGCKLIDSSMRIGYLSTSCQAMNLARYRLLGRYNELGNMTTWRFS